MNDEIVITRTEACVLVDLIPILLERAPNADLTRRYGESTAEKIIQAMLRGLLADLGMSV